MFLNMYILFLYILHMCVYMFMYVCVRVRVHVCMQKIKRSVRIYSRIIWICFHYISNILWHINKFLNAAIWFPYVCVYVFNDHLYVSMDVCNCVLCSCICVLYSCILVYLAYVCIYVYVCMCACACMHACVHGKKKKYKCTDIFAYNMDICTLY